MLTTIALSAALASVTTEGLLENAGAPAAQRVELDIHPGRTAYTGRTVITLQLDDPTDSVSLHADGVFIASATLGGVKAEVISEPKGAVTLQAAKVLDPGTVDLVIEFSGKYREGVMRHSPRETAHDEAMKAKQKAREAAEKEARTQGRTLPKPSEAEVKAEAKADKARMKDWKKNPEMEAVAWTALWPGKARYVFPSFDEPRFRIPITLEITAPSEMMVVAGTPETGSAPGAKGATVHTFAPTNAVPAYMVGFAVGAFKTHDVADAPVPTKVYAPGYAPPARVEQAVGMLGAQAKELEGAIGSSGVAQRVGFVEMADGTGIHGVPGFVAFDEEASPWAEDRATHVLAHDWFGGAVGPSTWEDLWVMEMLSAWADLRVAAKGDAGPYETSRLARAIVKEGGGGSTAKAASGYEGLDPAAPAPRVKGAAVLAMFAAHYGPGKLLDGVKAVIGTNTTTDLPGLLAAIGKSTGTDAGAEMTPWLEKPGVPLVTFTRTDTGFTVAQAPYVWSTEEAPEEPTAWMIPVAGRTAGGVVRAAIPPEGGKMDVGKGWFVPQAPAYVWTFADPADFDALIAAAGELRGVGMNDLKETGRFTVGAVEALRAGPDGLDVRVAGAWTGRTWKGEPRTPDVAAPTEDPSRWDAVARTVVAPGAGPFPLPWEPTDVHTSPSGRSVAAGGAGGVWLWSLVDRSGRLSNLRVCPDGRVVPVLPYPRADQISPPLRACPAPGSPGR
ncbi:MAG: hypothetical protein KC656_04335 [Myxococcales bacterium]|nr:hypothetical protein [Myxococcales bacterium]